MGFLADTIRESRSSDLIGTLKKPGPLLEPLGSYTTLSGVNVSTQSALGLSAVWACIKIRAFVEASLPLILYERLEPKGKRRATENPIYKMIHKQPNPEQTSFKWRSLMSVHRNLYGAGISEIQYDKNGYPVALWPIPTWCVKKTRTQSKQLIYEVNVDGKTYTLWPYQVLCFEDLQVHPDKWLSPIGVHRETIGSALAVREFGDRTFSQGTNPGAVISYQNNLKFSDENSEKDFKRKLRESYEGLSNSHRLMLLDQGAKFEKIGLPPEDAQFLETRKYGTVEVARIFNIPLHLLQETEKSTSWGSGIEEINFGFVAFSLTPVLTMEEQELTVKLIDDDKYFIEHLVDGLLRGKIEARFRAYAIGRQWGWLSADDVCEMENRNPLPDGQGQTYMNPLNMVASEYFKEISKPENGDNNASPKN